MTNIYQCHRQENLVHAYKTCLIRDKTDSNRGWCLITGVKNRDLSRIYSLPNLSSWASVPETVSSMLQLRLIRSIKGILIRDWLQCGKEESEKSSHMKILYYVSDINNEYAKLSHFTSSNAGHKMSPKLHHCPFLVYVHWRLQSFHITLVYTGYWTPIGF